MKKIKVYNLKKFVESFSDSDLEMHRMSEVAIFEARGLVLVMDHEAVGIEQNVITDSFWAELYQKPIMKNGRETISLFPCKKTLIIIKDVLEHVEYKEMELLDFFARHDYNDRCRRNFREMLKSLEEAAFDIDSYLPVGFQV